MASTWMTPTWARNAYGRLSLVDPSTPSAIMAAFDNLPRAWRLDLGNAIHRYKTDIKGAKDALVHELYAERYLGGPDDQNDEDDWRPTFAYFERRKWEANTAFAAAIRATKDLQTLQASYGIVNAVLVGLLSSSIAEWQPHLDAMQVKLRLLQRQRDDAERKLRAFQQAIVPTADVEMADVTDDDIMVDGVDDALGGAFVEMPEDVVAVVQPVDPPGWRWHGDVTVGNGRWASIKLWVQTDDQGIIRKRAAKKIFDLEPSWGSDHLWSNGAPGGSNWKGGSLPMEIHALREITNNSGPGPNSVVKYQNYSLSHPRKSAQLYMEYCPYGNTLQAIQGTYLATKDGRSRAPGSLYNDFRENSDLVPEPFVWSTFLSLVQAGILMERGSLDAAVPNWNCIVHREIKASHVFLGESADDQFPVYPQAKIADFAMAIEVPDPDTRPIGPLAHRGTPQHAAPEMHGKPQEARPSTKTNVWGVGIVLYSLMAGTNGVVTGDEGREWFQWNIEEKREPPAFDQSATLKYSLQLRNLVLACLRYAPLDRPNFDFLLREVQKHTGDGLEGDDRAEGLRDMTRAQGDAFLKTEENRHQKMSIPKQDLYRVGFTLAEVDWPAPAVSPLAARWAPSSIANLWAGATPVPAPLLAPGGNPSGRGIFDWLK